MVRLLSFVFLAIFCSPEMQAQVRIEALPEPGLQPQVCVSPAGFVHLVYLRDDPKACDVRYTSRSTAGGAWAEPVTVNSKPCSAIAIGTIRGAQIALGRKGSVHVIWNGNTDGKKESMMWAPLFHARLRPGETTFDAEQNMMGDTTALDGGASIAANEHGYVSIVWHAAPLGASGEAARLVYARHSQDDGVSFSSPTPLNPENPGVCACCSLRAHVTNEDELVVLYRSATLPTSRGMILLTNKEKHTTMRQLDDWQAATCPMSSASLLPTEQGIYASWENDGRIYTCVVGAPRVAVAPVGPKNAKHPSLAQNTKGQRLITSIIGSGWGKAGTLHWDILDVNGRITESGASTNKLPIWSFAAAYACQDDSFVILH